MEERFDIVPLDVRYQIEQYKGKVREAVEYVKSLDIRTKEEAEDALDIACEAINISERIEETKKSITEPAKNFKNEVDRLAREFTTQLDDVKSIVVDRIDDWRLRSPDITTLETPKVTTVDIMDYSVEVEDMMMVPKEYLTIDEAKIKLMMKQGISVIPGLSLTKRNKTSIRRK